MSKARDEAVLSWDIDLVEVDGVGLDGDADAFLKERRRSESVDSGVDVGFGTIDFDLYDDVRMVIFR